MASDIICNNLKKATFHEFIYFVVVTLATVGYGDIVPESEMGRLCNSNNNLLVFIYMNIYIFIDIRCYIFDCFCHCFNSKINQ